MAYIGLANRFIHFSEKKSALAAGEKTSIGLTHFAAVGQWRKEGPVRVSAGPSSRWAESVIAAGIDLQRAEFMTRFEFAGHHRDRFVIVILFRDFPAASS